MSDLRDRIAVAIREADSHSCMYGEGIDAADLADAVMGVLAAEPPTATDEDEGPPVQCWHIESGTPCDWDICRQPERLAAGDPGTDPGAEPLPTPGLDRLREAGLRSELAFEKEQRDDLRRRLGVTSDAWGELTDQLAAATAALARVQAFADKVREMPATGWITDRLDAALKLTPDPEPCARCKGHGVVPDWTNWDAYHGEPNAKPCPDCAAKETP